MTTTDHAALAREYIDLQARAEQVKDRMDEIKVLLATTLEVKSHDFDGVKVTISPNRRLDAKKFAENFPVAHHPTFYKASPDATSIKKAIGQNAYEGYCTEGVPRVTVKAA